MAERPKVSGEAAQQIAIDVGNGTPPEQSRLKYGPNELEFRKGVESRFAAYRKQYPDAIMDVRD